MSTDAFEKQSGYQLVDKYGREILTLRVKHDPPDANDILGADDVYDGDHRKQVVLDDPDGVLPSGPGGSGYSIVQDEGVPLTPRSTINFVGSDVTVTDAGGKTVVTIATPAPGPAYATVQDEGTPVAQRDTINFVGADVTVTDAGGKTVVTIATPTPPPAYATAEDEGTPVTQRSTMNFAGGGVTVTDSGGKTLVTIPSPPGGGYATVKDEGIAETQRVIMNFVGNGVDVTDDGTNTIITINGEDARPIPNPHTFSVVAPVAGVLPGFFVEVPAGRTVKFISCRAVTDAGTVAFRLRRNGADITDYGTAGSPLSATTTAATTNGGDVTCANNDYFDPVLGTVVTATLVVITLFFEIT